jgi:hypothetical protein
MDAGGVRMVMPAALAVHVAPGAAVPIDWQYVFGGAAILSAVAIVAALATWLFAWFRSHYFAWHIDFVDANLAGSLGERERIDVGTATDVRVRIRINVVRAISFEEIAVHPRKHFRRRLLRRWMFKLPDEDETGSITIVEIGDPEAEIYLLDQDPPWVRKFTAVRSRDHRGIWRGLFTPPYVRGRNEPLFIRVRLLATTPWDGHLFVRLMNDNERVFHPLSIEAVDPEVSDTATHAPRA